jgi:hypothetical protein
MTIRARAWAALLLPPIAWFTFEQGLSALLHWDCRLWSAGILWGLASLGACCLAVRLAWPLRRPAGPLADPWLGRLAIAVAGIFALAISLQTLATLIVPACVG